MALRTLTITPHYGSSSRIIGRVTCLVLYNINLRISSTETCESQRFELLKLTRPVRKVINAVNESRD